MPIQTTYSREDGTEASAQVLMAQTPVRRRRCLRDRIASMHLDLINPDLSKAFDSPVWVGLDLSSTADVTAVWVMDEAGRFSEVKP